MANGEQGSAESTILFLCQHGGAQSVIAASYFNRLAEQHALPYVAVAAAAEERYAAVPAPVAEFLQRDGFDVRSFNPRHVEAGEVSGAARVAVAGRIGAPARRTVGRRRRHARTTSREIHFAF